MKKKLCQIAGCHKKAVGQILIQVMHIVKNDAWYANVCQEHLEARKSISPDGKPLVAGFPQWKEGLK